MDFCVTSYFMGSIVVVITIKGDSRTSNSERKPGSTNGKMYYLVTTGFLLSVSVIEPQICVKIYENMGPIVGTLNVIALTLCLFLLIRGIQNKKEDSKEHKKTSILYQFMLGVDLHPRLFGMDVKQLTSPRLGNMMWQIFIIVYLVAGWKLHGFNAGHFVNVTLQSVYIFKAFHLEDYYFTMFEMMEDHAGYNLCWGSLVWMPAFYAFQAYFFVRHPSNISNKWAAVLFCLGLLAIYLNYDTCNQKRRFRKALESNTEHMKIWGRNAVGIPVQFSTFDGKQKRSQLLISGWWGMARKINYTFELLAIIMWSLPGFQYGLWYASYFLFLFVLMLHRAKYRHEIKCSRKYGLGWDEYCKKLKNKLGGRKCNSSGIIKIYRQIQLLVFTYNDIHRGILTPIETTFCQFVSILSLYGTIGLSNLVAVPLQLIFALMVVETTLQIFEGEDAIKVEIHRVSKYVLRKLRNLMVNGSKRVSIISLPVLSIHMGGGGNFFDETTPLVLLDFAINQTVGLLVMQ
ncbi:unnamed protein product [Orchesella dallaii]|uniref:7-dehydrocholesterol reductase n=1 Tax=Orchesella dallaii TaxID=48710 RepID=A0ABP1RHN6_9HEXA